MIVALILAAWQLLGSGPSAEQHHTFAVSGRAFVHAVTANGKIEVTTKAGSPIEVTVVKRADTQAQVDALGAEVQRQGNGVSLRALYPKGCGSGSCGGEVSFFVTAPPGTSFDLETSNGSIRAGGIAADAVLASSNGSVSASYAAFSSVKRVALSTSNGSVTLTLPASAKIGRLKMDTAVGHLASDWPVRVDRSSFVGGSVDQTLVPGAASVTLTTTNGSINLKKI